MMITLLDTGISLPSLDATSIMQFVYLAFFMVFMMYGAKLQLMTILAQISRKMKRVEFINNEAYKSLKTHLSKHMNITSESEKALQTLVSSIAIPPVDHLDTNGIVPKLKHLTKTYERFLKNGLLRIVGPPVGTDTESISQSDLENLMNSLEVAIELNMFYRVIQHFYIKAKKGDQMSAFMLNIGMGQMIEMAEALYSASGHFASGLPIGDGFGPMVAAKFGKEYGSTVDASDQLGDSETTVKYITNVMGRDVYTVKAKGPGGSVGNPAKGVVNVITRYSPKLAITIDAALRMESEKTGEIHEGVGVAMGGNGAERFEIEQILTQFEIPTLTVVCIMAMKEAITAMPKAVLDQVDTVYNRVRTLIQENSNSGDVVLVVGVGNTMGVE